MINTTFISLEYPLWTDDVIRNFRMWISLFCDIFSLSPFICNTFATDSFLFCPQLQFSGVVSIHFFHFSSKTHFTRSFIKLTRRFISHADFYTKAWTHLSLMCTSTSHYYLLHCIIHMLKVLIHLLPISVIVMSVFRETSCLTSFKFPFWQALVREGIIQSVYLTLCCTWSIFRYVCIVWSIHEFLRN